MKMEPRETDDGEGAMRGLSELYQAREKGRWTASIKRPEFNDAVVGLGSLVGLTDILKYRVCASRERCW
jgi:hypothetical protein